MTKNKGFSLIEVILTVGLMAIIMLTIVNLIFISNFQTGKSLNYQKALWVVEDGLNAMKTMSFQDLFLTQTGKVAFAPTSTKAGVWSLLDTGPENINGFTRYITVSEVKRDANCLITNDESGVVDPDTLKLQSRVTWNETVGGEREVDMTFIRTNWERARSACFDDSDLAQLFFDFSGTSWYGGKQLRSIYITNIGTRDVKIAKMLLTWDFDTLITQFFMDASKVWSSSGPGTPLGNQPSGTELDIADKTIVVGETIEIHKTQFTDNMEGSTISITVIMEDGTSTSTGEFMPVY